MTVTVTMITMLNLIFLLKVVKFFIRRTSSFKELSKAIITKLCDKIMNIGNYMDIINIIIKNKLLFLCKKPIKVKRTVEQYGIKARRYTA
jgi:hypothetical protein